MSYVLSDAVVRARKEHRCDQCNRRIERGQLYVRQVHTYEGFGVYKAHQDCQNAATDLHEKYDRCHDEGIYLADDVDAADRPYIAEVYPDVARRLWPHMVFEEAHV